MFFLHRKSGAGETDYNNVYALISSFSREKNDDIRV